MFNYHECVGPGDWICLAIAAGVRLALTSPGEAICIHVPQPAWVTVHSSPRAVAAALQAGLSADLTLDVAQVAGVVWRHVARPPPPPLPPPVASPPPGTTTRGDGPLPMSAGQGNAAPLDRWAPLADWLRSRLCLLGAPSRPAAWDDAGTAGDLFARAVAPAVGPHFAARAASWIQAHVVALVRNDPPAHGQWAVTLQAWVPAETGIGPHPSHRPMAMHTICFRKRLCH